MKMRSSAETAEGRSLSECIVQKHRHSLVPSMEAVLAVLGIEVVH